MQPVNDGKPLPKSLTGTGYFEDAPYGLEACILRQAEALDVKLNYSNFAGRGCCRIFSEYTRPICITRKLTGNLKSQGNGSHAPASVALSLHFTQPHHRPPEEPLRWCPKRERARMANTAELDPSGSGARLSASSDPASDNAHLRYRLLLAKLWKSGLVETKPGMLSPKPSSWL